jgi:DNA-binding transcriptional LysR family regulator
MRFSELQSLVNLAESGSLRATAAMLHLTPAAIHKQLRALQDEFDVPLYHKLGSKLRLTEAGNLILPYARSLLAQQDQATAAVQEWKGLRRGVLRIGSGPTIATYLLPGLLTKFRRVHPKIDIVVETGSTRQLLSSLRDGVIHLALLVEPSADAGLDLKRHHAWEFEIVIVAYQRRAAPPLSIRELSGETFVLFKTGGRMQEAIDRYFQKNEFHPKVAMRFDNADAIKAMVRGGFGLSMLPYWTVAADIKHRSLRLVRQTETPLLDRIVLASAGATHTPKVVDVFVEMARSYDASRWNLRSAKL